MYVILLCCDVTVNSDFGAISLNLNISSCSSSWFALMAEMEAYRKSQRAKSFALAAAAGLAQTPTVDFQNWHISQLLR